MSTHLSNESPFLDVKEVAKRYGVSIDTIWRWKRNKELPPAVRVGSGTTRWRLDDLLVHENNFEACFATHFSL